MRRLLFLSALLSLLLLAAAASSASAQAPRITSVSPLNVKVNQLLTIRGRNFRSGRNRNTVVFSRVSDRKSVVAAAGSATTRRLRVRLPRKLEDLLTVENGAKVATRFRIRVLTRGRVSRLTPLSRSPLVSSATAPTPGTPGTPTPDGTPPPPPDCDGDGVLDADDSDDDNDLLSDDTENGLKTNICAKDTDGDGNEDGWEYFSALDLNSNALPYPGKRPYPNALDPGDGNVDYDDDGLSAAQEHAAWIRYGNHAQPLNYSDGDQTTNGPGSGPDYNDMDGDGIFTDDEKDVDGDGLANEIEIAPGPVDAPDIWTDLDPDPAVDNLRANGATFNPNWPSTSPRVKSFEYVYNPDYLDPDSDGDGLNDGADDIDHDGVSNSEEIDDGADGTWSDPFNPCDPNSGSGYCPT